MISKDDFVFVEMSELITPRDHQVVYVGRWWCCNDNGDAAFYVVGKGLTRSLIPQCNTHQEIATRRGFNVVYVPLAFVTPNRIWT